MSSQYLIKTALLKLSRMTFEKLNVDNNCKCTEDGVINNISSFALKINKETIREADFKTYWEKGRTSTDCDEICSLKGQSLTIIDSQKDLDLTLKIYKELFPISPKYKPYCAVVLLNEDSGLVKLTPTEINPLHHDFYKSDEFTIEKVSLLMTIPLGDV
jgi:hypothetical protein